MISEEMRFLADGTLVPCQEQAFPMCAKTKWDGVLAYFCARALPTEPPGVGTEGELPLPERMIDGVPGARHYDIRDAVTISYDKSCTARQAP